MKTRFQISTKRSPSSSALPGRAAGDMVAVIVEDLAARPARPGLPHRPEIIGGRNADDAFVGQPGDLAPQRRRVVVGVIDGDRQARRIEPPFAGQQAPGVLDRIGLEILAEREIAEHFEKGVVARGVPDIVEIIVLAAGRADAGPGFCDEAAVDRTRARRHLEAGEDSGGFLNGTVPRLKRLASTAASPALTNIRVGSFCGTSGADAARRPPPDAPPCRNDRGSCAGFRCWWSWE